MFKLWDRTSKLLAFFCIFVVGFLWFLAVWRWRLSADFIPLHYTIYFGLDRFGPKSDLALFPVLGSVVFGVNAFLTWRLFPENQFARTVLLSFSALLLGALLVSFILIILKIIY